MTALRIDLKDNCTAWEPGAEMAGKAGWTLEKPARELELRLFWFTRGKGTEDAGLITTQKFEQPLLEETRDFQFQLPHGPYSFSGQLISLVWGLELIAHPSKEVVRREIIVAPAGAEVRLAGLPSDFKSSGFSLSVR